LSVISKNILDKTIGSRDLYTRITVMNFDFITTDEITGVVIGYPNFTNDATSDIRRTCTIELYPKNSVYDITYGGKLWMDKIVKVELGVKKHEEKEEDITYFNMGVYIIDNPSKTYSATENKITLNCLDLMCRLTGMRGGIIEGITHIIPQNANVRETIIAILKEGRINKYIVEECEIDVPYDITVDGGSSLYDLLKELVNLLPNYQIYFDVDGVFHYELIPNGESEPIMVSDDVWKDILINYESSYDFENVKNCIEVIGGAHDNPLYTFSMNYQRDVIWDEVCEDPSVIVQHAKLDIPVDSPSDYDGLNTFYMQLNGITYNEFVADHSLYNAGYICIEFPPLYDCVGKVSISGFDFKCNEGYVYQNKITLNEPIILDLQEQDSHYIYIKLSKIDGYGGTSDNKWTQTDYKADYLGEYQPRAMIYETNPDSPFFDSINYHCSVGFNPNETETVGGVQLSVLHLYIDEPWVNAEESLFTKVFQYTLNASSGAPMNIPDLHTTQDYLCRVHYHYKDGAKYVEQTAYRGYIKATLLLQGTHIGRYFYGGDYSQIMMPYQPNTLGTLRLVCSGDEYDNIWSDDLAMQRAKFELYQRCRLLDTVTITVVPQYWLDVNWLVEITFPNKNGKEETNQYLIKTITTDGGVDSQQTISLMRYYPYYPSIN
jgi:hypothetical protein